MEDGGRDRMLEVEVEYNVYEAGGTARGRGTWGVWGMRGGGR